MFIVVATEAPRPPFTICTNMSVVIAVIANLDARNIRLNREANFKERFDPWENLSFKFSENGFGGNKFGFYYLFNDFTIETVNG